MDYKYLLTKLYNVSTQKIENLSKENLYLKKQLEEFEEKSNKLENDKLTLINYFKIEIDHLKEEVEDLKISKLNEETKDDHTVGETAIDLQEFVDAQKELTNTNKKQKISIFLEIVLILMITLLLLLQLKVII